MKKRYDVEILREELSVVSDSGDEHVAETISYVSQKMEEARTLVPGRNVTKAAILAALNIADEYLQLKAARQDVYSRLEDRSEQLVRLIKDLR